MQEDRFNDIHRVGGRPLINGKQLKYAKSFVGQLTRSESSVLSGLKALGAKRRAAVSQRIHRLSARTLSVLERRTVYSSQLTQVLYRVQFKMHKLMIVERFTNVELLVLASVKSAALDAGRRAEAVSEIRSIYGYTRKAMLKVQKLAAFRSIFTGGVNSMNGALAKYVSESQMRVLDIIQGAADHVKSFVSHQPHLSVTAKYIAVRHVDAVLGRVKPDLMTTTNFNGIRSIQLYTLKELHQIADDENRSLNNLTAFTKFTNHLTGYVAKLSQLSADTRLRLKTRVVQRQREVLTRIQRTDRVVTGDSLGAEERRMSERLVTAVSKGYQGEIGRQAADLTDGQRDSLASYIDKIASDLVRGLQKGSRVEPLVKKSLRQLNRQVTERENRLVYLNRTRQVIDTFRTLISNQYDLASVDKADLRTQVVAFGRQARKEGVSPDDMTRRLSKWLKGQVRYLLEASLRGRFRDLRRQIRFSHLAPKPRQKLLRRLKRIARAKLDYHRKMSLIGDVSDYGLSLDKNTNLRRLTGLNDVISHQVQNFSISPAQGKRLGRNLVGFSQRINGLKRISATDHLEQSYEDRIYSYLCRPNLDDDPLRVKVLSLPIDQAQEACRRIDLEVFDRFMAQYVNDRIDRRLCVYLRTALLADDASLIKPRMSAVISQIKGQLAWALSWVKKNYVAQLSGLTLNVYHQLIAYAAGQSPRKIEDRAELINSHVAGSINNAGDLLHVEQARQLGLKSLGAYAGELIDRADSAKASARRSISAMAASLHGHLQHSWVTSSEVKQASRNQILSIVNRAVYRLNRSPDDEIDACCRQCRKALNQVLRHDYLQEWLKISGQAQLSVQRLENVPIDSKIQVLSSLQGREAKVASQIRNFSKDQLNHILAENQRYIQRVVRHGIYLNPAKKKVRSRLDQLIGKVRSDISEHAEGKIKSRALKQLNKRDLAIDRRILNSDDKKLQPIYGSERKHLSGLAMRAVSQTQLKHFNVYIKKTEHQLHQLPLLSAQEGNHADMQFNRYYHKYIYQIRHAEDIKSCVADEQQGKKQFSQILADHRRINHRKGQMCQAIKSRVASAGSQIKSLTNLQSQDKHDSYHLLDQIRQQTVQNIKASDGAKRAVGALKKGRAMAKQVIDKVSSAGVLVSAIKTANDQIAKSTLDPKQKKATLRQINQIIDNGIHSQFGSGQPSTAGHSAAGRKGSDTQGRQGSAPLPKTGGADRPAAKDKAHHRFI